MITTGSKFFFGVGVYGLLAALAYAIASNNEYTGTIALAVLGVAALFLGGVTVAFRDSEVATAALPDGIPEDADTTTSHGPLVSPSPFPILGAFGAALLILGLVFERWMVWIGGILLIATLLEWVVQSWADRASDDAEYNRSLRNRFMHPVEFPILGALAVGLVIFGFSRVMLSLTKNAAIVVFVLVAGLVLIGAAVLAGVKRIGGDVIIGTLLVGGIIVLTSGVITAVHGERSFEEHAGEGASSETVANVANVAARLELNSGTLAPSELSIPRSAETSLTFTNLESEERQLVIEAADGMVCGGKTSEEPQECATGFVQDGESTFLTFRLTLPGTYPFHAVGHDGGEPVDGTITVA